MNRDVEQAQLNIHALNERRDLCGGVRGWIPSVHAHLPIMASGFANRTKTQVHTQRSIYVHDN